MSRDALPRRAVLKRLSVCPVALALGGGAAMHALSAPMAATTSPDAALIAFAAKVVDLARREHVAVTRRSILEDKLSELEPPRPTQCEPEHAAVATWSTSDLEAGVERVLRVTFGLEAENRQAMIDAHAAAVAAWEAECEAINQSLGMPACNRLCERLGDRLDAATRELTAMVATTMAGVAAKAWAWIAIEQGGNRDDWTADLAAAWSMRWR